MRVIQTNPPRTGTFYTHLGRWKIKWYNGETTFAFSRYLSLIDDYKCDDFYLYQDGEK